MPKQVMVLFEQFSKTDYPELGYIKLKSRQSSGYGHVILSNLQYRMRLSDYVKADENTIIIPCYKEDKTAFARLSLE